jgi:AhpD family alkylhydroperoxidase
MQQRMTNPAMLFPETYQAVQALSASSTKAELPERTVDLVHLRASQVNGCSLCVDMHARMAQKSGETDHDSSPWPPGVIPLVHRCRARRACVDGVGDAVVRPGRPRARRRVG